MIFGIRQLTRESPLWFDCFLVENTRILLQVFPDVEYCLMREKFRDIVTKADRFEWVNEAKVGALPTSSGACLPDIHVAFQDPTFGSRKTVAELVPASELLLALCPRRCDLGQTYSQLSMQVPRSIPE